MTAAVDIGDDESQGTLGSPRRRALSLRTPTPVLVALTHQESLLRRPTPHALMGPMLSIPEEVGIELVLDRYQRNGHDDGLEALVLHGADEPFDDSDAAVLSEGAEARPDAVGPAPGSVGTLKLHAPVGGDVLGQ